MRLRYLIASLLLSSTMAAATDAPVLQKLTECQLNLKPSLEALDGLAYSKKPGKNEYDEPTNRLTYQIDAKPFGLTMTKFVYVEDYDDDYGVMDSLEIEIKESYDIAKARIIEATGARPCAPETGSAGKRKCALNRPSDIPTIWLHEAKGHSYFDCNPFPQSLLNN